MYKEGRDKREGDVIFSQPDIFNSEVIVLHISPQLSSKSQIEIKSAAVLLPIHTPL